MKKMSKKTRSSILNGLLIVGTILIVLYLGARNGDIGDAWTALVMADRGWIAGAFISCLVFIVFETLVLHVFYRFQQVPVRFASSLLATLIGMYYSSITPAATGGQPMQVLAMNKRGIPGGVTSSGLAVKFFCFQSALLSMAAVLWAVYPDFVGSHIGASRWFIYTGFFLNGTAVLCVILLAINQKLVQRICDLLLIAGHKVRIIRDLDAWKQKLDHALEDFHASVFMITKHPFQLLCLFLLSCLQVLGLMSVAYCVYRALGLQELDYLHILTLQLLLYIGAAFTPLPGASGAQEGGFYLIFQTVFPGDKLLGALLLWRFFTYYLPMLSGLGSVISDSVRTIRGKIPKLTKTENTSAKVS